uniref:Helicase ATP-binding domain-containing protein n=1 Tax=viral metagenome TaxID=1070528 RepID=A0A6C0ERC1_9ZZZZ
MSKQLPKNKLLVIESSSSVKSDENIVGSKIEDPINISKMDSEMDSSSLDNSSTSQIMQSEKSNEDFSSDSELNKNNLETEFKKLNCSDENYYSNECNKFLLKKELIEENYLSEHPDLDPFLYPNLSDKNFNIKISNKKEFNDTKYEGTIHKNIKEQADILAKADFELQPHQAFVKNFMSSQTPYNSLLLYHGLGSGKTCSAIGVCEEARDYMRQMGTTKRIMIVASENVQDNFRLQLFDERKLKLVDGIWNIRSCTGNKLLQEINPMNMKGITREKLVSQIKNLINTYYIFLGYGQFANYIIKTMNYTQEVERIVNKKTSVEKRKSGEKTKIQMLKDEKIVLNSKIIRRLKNEFDNRLIVIDEVHNIRKTDDNENKKVAINLELLVKSANNMRFLLLSATPMYNSYKEIVWLLNLMNTNDRRGRIEVRDIFDKNGNLKKNGEELLIRKSTGYVSFVRGENPYTFPYRVYPNEFAKENTFNYIKYPSYQMNLKKIPEKDKNRILSLYLDTIGNCNKCGVCQGCVYKYIIHNLRNKSFSITTKTGSVRNMPSFENMESFGYTLLQTPLESLIISYPMQGLKEIIDKIPNDKLSDELSESFSETPVIDEENKEEDIPGLVIESESEQEESITEPKTQFKTPLIIEDSDSEIESEKYGGQPNVSLIDRSFIDPHELTGKKGLERMMNYVDNKSPPEKGNFEYKKSTLDQYGKIFNQSIIGSYSWKIKKILDSILDPNTGKVSEGIILIYSQYIDSGLIPMALALEEMGFTRYGENVKPLFKNRPSEVVDVRTMKPPTDKKNFMPARYSMITGDPRISPNNDYEVKGLTDDNKETGNVTGNKVKVILISKAGSEGIDLKFIRQVHILEPWYNMNRTEQIIGRAVRNFSHKDLPFEKRNVQIFMYGTIIGDENNEEAADLYVYRVAEYKAIQMGRVSRIIKESAVDCIINHDQTNFSQEIMNDILDEPVTQELSNGLVMSDFKIGDAPFSPACDYMETCYYSCKPTKSIDETNLNEDTYNENFIMMNSEKILQRIRGLMKESYFYKKDVLFASIQTPKQYPYVQIYAALTHLIEDNNEFITDRYGRNGRLINVGEYYLFQPIELNEKTISIFDRMVPIDYKHDMINFEINKNIAKTNDTNKGNDGISNVNLIHSDFSEGEKIVKELKSNFDITREFTKTQKVPRGDDNWYKHCGIAMKKLSKDYPDIKEYLLEFLVDHMIELLMFKDKRELMNYLYSIERIERSSFEWYAKKYFEGKSIVTKNFIAIILYNLNKRVILLLNKENKWVESEPEDQMELAASKEAKQILSFDIKNYNKLVGFIGYEKNNRYLVFKTKDMDSSRDTGARCDEAGKDKTLKKINDIIGDIRYTNENTKVKKDSDGNVISEAIGHTELCVIQELLLRYFDKIKKNDKKWFLSPDMAIYHKLYKVI